MSPAAVQTACPSPGPAHAAAQRSENLRFPGLDPGPGATAAFRPSPATTPAMQVAPRPTPAPAGAAPFEACVVGPAMYDRTFAST